MPPRLYSRHTYTTARRDAEGRLYLDDRTAFRYRALPDNITHVVGEGETLFSLAARYFDPLERPAGLWWIIADYQPDPIIDPTITLTPGSQLVIPSLETVLTRIFSEDRRDEVAG